MPNKYSEKEMMGILPLTIASKTMKYLRINLTKEANDLCNENFKSLKTLENKKTFYNPLFVRIL